MILRKPGSNGTKVELLFCLSFSDLIYCDYTLKSRIIATTLEPGIEVPQNQLWSAISDYPQSFKPDFSCKVSSFSKILPNI